MKNCLFLSHLKKFNLICDLKPKLQVMITDMTAGIVGKQLIIEMPVWFTPKGARGIGCLAISYQRKSVLEFDINR